MAYKNLLGTVFLIVLSFCPKVPIVRHRLLYMFYTGRRPNSILLSVLVYRKPYSKPEPAARLKDAHIVIIFLVEDIRTVDVGRPFRSVP